MSFSLTYRTKRNPFGFLFSFISVHGHARIPCHIIFHNALIHSVLKNRVWQGVSVFAPFATRWFLSI